MTMQNTAARQDRLTWNYLPFGIHSIKLFVEPPTGLGVDRLWVRPLQWDANPNLVCGHEDTSRDLWIIWGGGKRRGYPLALNQDERYAYFSLFHRGETARPGYPLTFVAETEDGREIGRTTVEVQVPRLRRHIVPNPLRPVWTPRQDGSRIGFAGEWVPVYQARWWPEARLSYRRMASPNIWLEYERTRRDGFGAVRVHWGDAGRLLVEVTGRLETALHDLRLFSANLFNFHGQRYWVLRLWFHWLHTRFRPEDLLPEGGEPPDEVVSRAANQAQALNALLADRAGEEVPDAERFDLLFDAGAGEVLFIGTDLHWQELWGRAEPAQPVNAQILHFGLENLVYGFVTYVQGERLRKVRDETYSPSAVLKRMAAQDFIEARPLVIPTLRTVPTPPQCHVPYVDDLKFRDEFTSGYVKQGQTARGAITWIWGG
jgi:hypothetical protein